MTLAQTLAEPVPNDFPNLLALPTPHRPVLAPRPLLLLGLVLLCLIPRAIMSYRIEGLCPDAVLYIDLGKALEAGDLRGGLREMQVNTFPVILMLLHRLGFSWELGGEVWGVVIASLVVLPMYGWARRQFNDRVAVAACLLYACHPKLIVWSPELIRDPTFWFLFMLSIYLIWRAVVEVRIGMFLLAGMAMTLSWLTRFEGLFLLIPLALWTFWRWWALTEARKRLVLGAILSVVALPALLALINFTFLHDYHQFALSRLRPLSLVQAWVGSVTGSAAADAAASAASPAASLGMPLKRMIWVFIPTMTRGLSGPFAILLFGGIWKWRRVWSRRDHQALFYTSMAVVAGIWIDLWFVQVSCPRYAFSIVLMGSVFAALGLLGVTSWIVRLAGRLHAGARLVPAVAAAPLAIVALLAVVDVRFADFDFREAEIELGDWARQEVGPSAQFAGPVGITTCVSFYAGGRCETFPLDTDDATIAALVQHTNPDVLLLCFTRRMPPDRYDGLIAAMKQFGLEQVEPSRLPPRNERVLVLTRSRSAPRVAQRPSEAQTAH